MAADPSRRARTRHYLRIYRRSLGVHLRAALEYETDFWILVGASAVVELTGIVFLSVIFTQVPMLNGWDLPSALLIFALMAIANGLGRLVGSRPSLGSAALS